MDRRTFLKVAGIATAAARLGESRTSWGEMPAEGWRTFELTTTVKVLQPSGVTRVWIPQPLLQKTIFQRALNTEVQCSAGEWKHITQPEKALGMIAATFPAGVDPVVTVSNRVQVRNWSVDLERPGRGQHANREELQACLEPNQFVPTDGLVRKTALEITSSSHTDEEKARALYEWVVANTYRKASVRGCGTGDVGALLASGDLGGKCADLNALYVGLARAAGVPARDVYGLRVAPSRLGYKSLGPATPVVTKAQHCRAEVWLERYGWLPVDPADVRKVILEEPTTYKLSAEQKISAARERLFGSWEMNWVALNYGQDVTLPESSGPPLHFFMYPQAETSEGRLDSLDPDTLRYEITAKEITAEEA